MTAQPMPTLASPVTFPRASEQQSREYVALYRQDAKPLMRAWVADRLVSFEDLFELGSTTMRDALLCAHEQATAEIGRAVNANESLLIAECARDILVARIAERKRDRAMQREVL